MIEILWLGRGGQGAFTAAKLLGASYATKEGGHSLAFPSFGPERRGAPVRAFTKLDSSPILDRSETEHADYIVILDETLYNDSLLSLLKEGGKVIINSKQSNHSQVIAFDGDTLARSLKLPVVNTVMMGALSGISEIVTVEEMQTAIENYMPVKIREKNQNAVRQAVQEVQK